MEVKINKSERTKVIKKALVRRSTLVFTTDADDKLAKHLRQVKDLPERVIQDLGEMKILAFK